MAGKKDLADFVRDALTAGRSRAEIGAALGAAGWSESEIRNAMDGWAETEFTPPVPRPQAVVTARDFFVYAVTFGALIFAASYLVVLLHLLIDIYVGDDTTFYGRDRMRWAMAILIVTVPLYLWLTMWNRRRLNSDASLYRSAIRKWMIYMALLLAAATLLCDLVFVIYQFLNGELSLQFLLKAVTVALVAGGVFLYYLTDIRRGDT